MNYFLFSLKALMPILVPMVFGYALRRFGLGTDATWRDMNRMIFHSLLPLMLFMNIVEADMSRGLELNALIFCVLTCLGAFLLAWLISLRAVHDRALRGMFIQGIYRGNFVLFGIPLVEGLYHGPRSGITELLVAVLIPMFNVLAVLILQYYGDTEQGPGRGKKLLLEILRNPLIIASAAALLFKLSGLGIPDLIEAPLLRLSSAATPLALLVLGAQFRFSASRKYLRELLIALPIRLILLPAITLTLAAFLPLSPEARVACIALSASPVAVSSFTMAQAMCRESEFSGQILAYSTVFCLPSLLLCISCCSALGWF